MATCWRPLFAISLLAAFGFTARQSGPYDVIIEKLERCVDSGTDESIFPTRMTKVSRDKAVVNDSFRLYPEYNEHSKVEVELQEWGNQGFRPRSFLIFVKTCTKVWKTAGPNLEKLFASTGANITGCPIPAGNYSSQDLVMDFRMSTIPVMMYNKYRMIITLFHRDRKVGCSRFYIEVIPKEKPAPLTKG